MSDKIPRAFMDTLVAKLGTTKRQVYNNIGNIAAAKHVTSRTASFILAYERGINYQKYVTPEDLAEMRAVQGVASIQTLPVITSAKLSKNVVKGPSPLRPIKQTRNNSVFVVHGRDTQLNDDIFNFLRTLGLNPMEWSQAIAEAKGANPNIGQTINSAMKKVQAVVVMFSPDEDAKLKSKFCAKNEKVTIGKTASQARPNVLFEAGLALGAHPDKTLLVQVGEMREISDIGGKHILRLTGSAATRNEFAQRLKKMGLKVDTSGQDWTKVGNFVR